MLEYKGFNYSSGIEISKKQRTNEINSWRSSIFRNVNENIDQSWKIFKKPKEYSRPWDVAKAEKTFVGSKFSGKIEPLKFDNQFENAAVSELIEPIQYPLYQNPYKMTKTVRSFIIKQKKSSDLFKSINHVRDRISKFFDDKKIKSELLISLEIDEEYNDWIEPAIKVFIDPQNFERAYELFDLLLDFSLEGVRKKDQRRFAITLEMK